MKKKERQNRFWGLFLNFLDYFNPLSGLHELYLVIKYYIIFRKTTLSNEFKFELSKINEKRNSSKYRIDNLGRIYTIVNIPPDIIGDEDVISRLCIEEIRAIDKLLMPLGLTDIITPYIDRQYDDEKNAYYVLIVIAPNTSFFTFSNIIWEIIKITALVLSLIYLI